MTRGVLQGVLASLVLALAGAAHATVWEPTEDDIDRLARGSSKDPGFAWFDSADWVIESSSGSLSDAIGGWARDRRADAETSAADVKVGPAPVPAVAWLLGGGLVGLLIIARRRLGAMIDGPSARRADSASPRAQGGWGRLRIRNREVKSSSIRERR